MKVVAEIVIQIKNGTSLAHEPSPMPRPPEILQTALLVTPLGDFLAHFSAAGLARLDFPVKRVSGEVKLVNGLPAPFRAWAEQTQTALQTALSTTPRRPAHLPPLDLSQGTKFRLRVWPELLRIPRGETRSYGELADDLGKPRAARAVGGACGANPIPVLIPCHRVLTSKGGLGGFSGGAEWKRRLLALEGVLLT